ncbi:acyl-CoA thioester hydrolase [Streptosporangium subroseum]|uniref:Acyl-CoA thioester hydrolase n=1 Tax=Streptosporangium subroseum TaxID=106412 RepID=A0A239LZT3_9ACTN|nr:acyl-CoA thioester hydrolase [Streptosporangium subroseum]
MDAGPRHGAHVTEKQGPVGVHHTRVEWVDTDAAGIYHNTAVVRFVESAEAALMRERGLHDYFPKAPRVRYEVEFEAPLRFGQEVTAVVELTRIGASSMTFSFEVWGEEFEGRPRTRAAHGSYVTVHVADSHRRSSRWPGSWRAALTT